MTQKETLDILKLGHNVYLTGSAGSGKTYLLNEYIRFLKSKGVGVGVTASTGIAATHMNGVTIHSWSGIGIKDKLTRKDLRGFLKKRHLLRRFEKTKVLIIDEVSMLHSFRLDMVDEVCKAIKQNIQPFGGMQVVLCGDFFQLPPVCKNNENVNFIDKSKIWRNMNLKVCYLNEQYRHKDDVLTKILNDMRTNDVGEHTLEPLRKRYKSNIEGAATPTKLYTHNTDVDRINLRELNKLEGKVRKYEMEYRGDYKLAETLKKSCLAPEELQLKRGAMVMFVKNNFDEGYVNGTLGKIIDFDSNKSPVVKTFNNKEIVVDSESWKIEEDGKVRAEIFQVPLRLAWAITVHKSQGMTLDAAEIDLSKSFVEGMGYVALSRLRSLDGLRLMGLNKMALESRQEVLELDESLIKASETNTREFSSLNYLEKEKRQKQFLLSIMPERKEEKISTYEKTKLLVEEKLSIKEIAEHRGMTEGTILGHLEKISSCGEDINLEYLCSLPTKRLEKIKTAFEQTGGTKLSPVRAILGKNYSYEELRLARLFLGK